MKTLSLSTPRLELLLEDTETVLARIDALPLEDRTQVSPVWLEQMRTSVPGPWTHGFRIVAREAGAVVGSCGYKGGPDDAGIVELAYTIETSHRGKGYAKEAASALVAYAYEAMATGVCAHTLPATGASTAVLASCGFTRIGQVIDPEDGVVWRWEHSARDEADDRVALQSAPWMP